MKTSSVKAKGRGLQNKIVRMILATFPQLEPDDVQSCTMGANGEDVRLSPAARRLFPFTVEAKKRARFSIMADYDQARGHGPHEPLLVIEADRRKPLAVVDLATFLDLVERAGRK